jgi:hypothetical protein
MAAGAGAFKAMLACLIGEFVLILASIERDVEPSNSQAQVTKSFILLQ